jgi:RimJ/RimL family protein N-acetyltransferase
VTDLDLVPPTPELMAQVLEWRNRPEVTRWLIRTTVDPQRYTQTWLDSTTDPLDHSSIVLADGRAIATASLEIRDGSGQFGHEPEFESTEGLLGYLVDPAYAGRGIATWTAARLIDRGFGELGLRRVTAGCFADNTASWRVMEKVGMRREQHAVRDAWHADLGWVDGFTYAILAEEWSR